ncbi:MAG TPA: asparagine--tRNA ligase [Chloroflexi bacterium]|nr:asparagine--tRNA ligase [Chloroflexota bacterium]|tara:strand:+ start:2770 stop:4101 length:1332 start_codon:yes stop_codon:yes gene_type:complete
MIIQINDISAYIDKEIIVQGWIHNKTGKGKINFIQLRDGTGIVQCVVFQNDVSNKIFDFAQQLTQESSVLITGVVRKDERAPGIPGGFEIGVTNIQILQSVNEYPITPKNHGVDFLLDRRHLWIRAPRQWAILRIRACVMRSAREWLDQNGFLEISTPIITPAAAEGTSTLFELDYFGKTSYLSQTGQLYNEANIMSFGKVYAFGPTFRAEKSKTRKHVTEFWMVEPEIAYCDLVQLLEIEEQFVSHIVQSCINQCTNELEILKRDINKLKRVVPPFPRITYDDAIQKLIQIKTEKDDTDEKTLIDIEWGDDFGAPHETALTKLYDKPIFVTHYPTEVKAFYMPEVENRPEVCYSADLLAPEGYGEIIGGSERIHDYDTLVNRIKDHNLPIENYNWYLDLRKFGSIPHAGFGMGIERTVSWICGVDHIRETSPYPRMINRDTP